MENKDLTPAGLTYMADNIRRKDNIVGVSKSEGARWAKDLKLPETGETIFFAGCGYQFDNKLESLMGLIRKMDKSVVGTERAIGMANLQKKIGLDGLFMKALGGSKEDGQPLRDAIKILHKLGINPAYLGEKEPCCGGLLHFMGQEAEFIKHARDVDQKLRSMGVRRIISIVPSCTYTLRNLMSAACNNSSGLEVKHFSQVVAENIKSLKLRFPKPVKVTYHDPCQLVRYLGIVEEPRAILNAIQGIELVEPAWTKREFATCCGGGGGFEAVYPEMSEMVAVNRAKELVETGAQIIVTSCPGCIMQLRTGLKGAGVENVEVLDLSQIIAMSLEDK